MHKTYNLRRIMRESNRSLPNVKLSWLTQNRHWLKSKRERHGTWTEEENWWQEWTYFLRRAWCLRSTSMKWKGRFSHL